MAKMGIAAQWLRDNADEKLKRRGVDPTPKLIKVKYHAVAVEAPGDMVDAKASEDHAAGYRKHHSAKRYRTSGPHCKKASWLMDRRSLDLEGCVFFPNSHPGFPERVRYNSRVMAASRAMCFMANGAPTDEWMQALHTCGNGHLSCVNPKHLRWGTVAENAKDRTLHADKRTASERIAAVKRQTAGN